MKRIVLCIGTSNSLNSAVKHFIQMAHGRFEVYVIHEVTLTPRRTFVVLRSIFKKQGLVYLLDYIFLKVFFLMQKNSADETIPFYGVTEDINNPETIQLIKGISPDHIVGIGTGYIKSKTLRSFDVPFLNLHCGVNPRYRGNGSIWAIKENEWDFVGVSLHHMTQTIDEGLHLFRKRTPLSYFVGLDFSNFEAGLFKHGLEELFKYLSTSQEEDDFSSMILENHYYPYISFTNWLRAKKNYLSKMKSLSIKETL